MNYNEDTTTEWPDALENAHDIGASAVDADVRPRNPLHNQHVYVYWRWKGFVAERCGRHMKAFVMRDWARQEAEAQSAA